MALIGLKNVKKAMAGLKDSANDDVRAIYINGLKTIVKPTPVDEGEARNGWFLSVGTPDLSGNRSASKSGSGSFADILKMPLVVLGKKIFYTNNKPYMGLLEYGGFPQPGTDKTVNGFSTQVAPKGWVRIALKRIANKIRAL